MKEIIKKINNKSFKIGIIGLGYVGLPLCLRYAKSGFRIIGFDIDKKKIENLRKGKSYINHIDFSFLKKIQNKGSKFVNDFSLISNVDIIILCLPTPLKKNNTPELKFIKNTLKIIKKYLKKNQVLSLESTTYPGTTEEIIAPVIKKKFLIGKDFFLIYSPEREDPGRNNVDLKNIPKVLGGYTKNCSDIGEKIYSKAFKKIIKVDNLKIAELTKLLENIYRSVNIGLVNEMKIISDKMGIDIHKVIKASSTKPFGFKPFHPGPGLGGHCIPIDPLYLTWKAKKYGVDTNFIKLSALINKKITYWVVSKLFKIIKNIKKPRILILGVAYKKNIDDVRESPALKIMEILAKKKILFQYYDPYVRELPRNRNYYKNIKSIKISPKRIKSFNAIILVTDHDVINWGMIQKNAKLILDTRNVYKKKYDNVIKS